LYSKKPSPFNKCIILFISVAQAENCFLPTLIGKGRAPPLINDENSEELFSYVVLLE
jgi:hypothetical protein